MSSTGTTVSTEDVHKLEGTSPSYEPQDMPPRHFWPHVMTDFHSVTSVEPMEQCTAQQSPLEMTCEAHGPNEVHSSLTTPENMALSSRKKTSFADHAEVVNISKDEGLDAQAFVEFMDDTEEINNHLLEQFENISVSTHSETSAEIDELNLDAEVQSNARLDQITTRIFATVLPDDETPQQRHCDLVQAQRRLYVLTSGAEVLLINCGESNAQLMTVFKVVQNCPFNLDAPPDLATYVAFAERVHDWLLVASSRAVLLHAEGTTARTRLLLLIRALSCYYEAKDRHDPNSSRLLRQYVVSYPNGIISSPIGWLRFAGYLGLFSPDSCLSILRANLCIYTLCLHNFPVFEENKLRLFVKFYTGSPLRHAYTTAIHDFYHSDSNNLALAFSHCLDVATTPPCLIIQGNITVIAYHCRPYPHKRLRLFRLHFHSCEGCFEPLTFHRDDFDELCDAFPSTVLLELLCTNRPLTTHATVQVTNVDWQFAKGAGIPSRSAASLNQLSCAMSSDEAVRRHDSLEHLTDLAINSQSVRKVLFRSINEHTNPKLHPNTIGVPLHLSKSLTDGQDGVYDHIVLPKVRLKGTTEKPTASINKRSFLEVFVRQPAGSMEKRDEKGVQVSGNIEPRTLMPPPTETQVPKIKRIIGKRLVKLFSKRGSKEYTFKTDNSSESSSGSESFSSEDSTGKRSDGWLSELLSSSSRKARASFRGLSSPRSSPPRKTRKMDNAVDTNASTFAAVPFHRHSEDLLEAARRLNFMAGTQELDRLLEELRLTSMQMAAGLPPPKATAYAHTYTPRYSTIHSTSTHSQNRLHTTRSSSSAAMGQVGGQNEHTYGSSSPNVHPSSYTYQRQSSYHTEGRLDGLNKPAHYTTPRSHYYPSSSSRHQTTYTTVLKQRPPIGPRQLSQVHLTIDPECGANELPHTTTHSSERDVNLREQRLENELNLARRELAQLRRAMSLVEERRRHEFNEETRSSLSPAYLPMARSPASVQQQFLSTSSSYQSHHLGTRSTSSTFQRSSPRQEGPCQEQSGVMHRRQSYKKQSVWNEVRPLSIKREMHIVNLDSSTKDCVVRNIPIIHCSSRPTETGPRSTLDFTVANHRKQNCHEADCFYCMSQAAQNGWRGSNAEGSLSSSDQEDKYPQVSATFPVYGQSSPHPTLSSVQSQHAHQRAEVDMTQGGGHTPKAHNPFSPTSSLSTGSREKNTIQVNMGDTHTTSMKLSRNGVQLSKKHSHQNGLITQMEPLFVLKNGDFDDTNTPGSTSTNSTKSNVFVSSLGCIESRSRLKAGEAYEQYGTTATVSVLADEEATLSCTAHREPVAPAFELTYVKPVSIVSTCTMNTNPNLSQKEIASPNYPALVSKFGVEHSKSPHTNSHSAAAATYVLQSVDEIKSTRALSSNQQLDITHSSPLTAELDVSDGVGTSVGTYGVPKRAMSQTNMQTTRSWNLRSQHQGSETDLAFKRVTSVSQPPGRSGYSAHRERLRQEREQELLMRQHRQRQLAASTTGLNEQHLHRHQQQYRSLSAVNTTGGTDAFEEVETIILQPIGRGVQDIDSRTGSMTTLHRGPTGSMMEGLHRVDDQHQRNGLVRRGYSSTQYLNRNTSNTDLSRPLAVHQSHATIVPTTNMQSLQNSRYDTTSTLVNNTQTAQFSGSRSHLTNTSSSTLAPAQATTVPNGWKTETTKRTYIDGTETNPLSLVQETAPLWYRPHLSRDAAISILRQQPPGSFLIRDSTTFKGAFGLAVKVATLPPKVTPKSDDLQAELVRHYLIEVINTAPRGVRLKGFASEPVFPSLAALIHEHTIDQLALPCKLILPPGPTNLPSSGTGALPHLVVGTIVNSDALMVDNATVTSAGSLLGPTASDSGSVQMDSTHQMEDGNTIPIHATEAPATSTHNVPLVCVLRENAAHQRRSPMDMNAGQGLTFRCLMLGSVDSAQWGKDLCFARAVDQLIPLTQLTAAECDHGVSRVRYTEVQLRVSAHDGITIIDLLRRLFLRRHLPNHVLLFCGLETRKKEFLHPEHQAQGIVNPKIFGIVVRKGITEYTTHVFSECDPAHPAESIVQHIRTTYPHLMSK